jgi:membrane fusion protein
VDQIYRPEAVAAAQSTTRSVPLLARQPSWRFVLLLFVPALFGALAFTALARFDQRLPAQGVLLPQGGLVTVAAVGPGQVIRVHRGEGETVRAGDALFEISDVVRDANGVELREQRLRLLRAELDVVRAAIRLERQAATREAALLQRRIGSLSDDERSLAREAAIGQERIALAEAALPGLRRLAERGLLSAMQLADQEAALLTLRADQEARQRQRRALQREREAATHDLASRPRDDAARDSIQTQREHALQERLAELIAGETQIVRAASDGVIAAMLVARDAAVVAGQPLATLAPVDSPLQAIVLVAPAAPGELRAGQRAVIRVPAFPHQRYGHLEGEVQEISGAPLSARQLQDAGLPVASDAAMYRVSVRLVPRPSSDAHPRWRLKPGMRVEAELMLGRRRLLDWLLDPLRGLRPEPVR